MFLLVLNSRVCNIYRVRRGLLKRFWSRSRIALYNIQLLPRTIFDGLTPYIWPSTVYAGIRILDPNEGTRAKFTESIAAALDLIAIHDQLRFRRIQREIHSIVNLPSTPFAAYARPLRVCDIRFASFAICDDESTNMTFLATLLLHEATHGYLFTKGVVQTRATYARVEAICCKEMNRFARKLGYPEVQWSDKIPLEPSSLKERLKHVFTELRNT